jgi:hypothetical protein
MPDASLITEEVRALVGTERGRSLVQVTARMVQRTEDVYLGSHGPPRADGDEAPALVLMALDSFVDQEEFPTLLPDSLLVSNEVSVDRPLRVGEELEAVNRLADVYERFGGRFGYSIYFRGEVEFREPGGGPVVGRSARLMMQYSAASATDAPDE